MRAMPTRESCSCWVPWIAAINTPCRGCGARRAHYNSGKIKAIMPNAPLDSLDMILKKAVAAKFAGCGISMLDSGATSGHGGAVLGQPRLSADRRNSMP